MVKRYTARLVHQLQAQPALVRLLLLLPYLFLIAVLITNTFAWLKGAPWHYSVVNTWLLAGWLATTVLLHGIKKKEQ